MSSKIAIIGAGAWGTAFAIHLARLGMNPFLWARERKVLYSLEKERRNHDFLPGIKIPQNIVPKADIGEVVSDADKIFWVVPTQFLRSIAKSAVPKVNAVHIAMSKGIERESWKFPYQILAETFDSEDIAVLSGPSFAEEVAQGKPTVMVAASNKPNITVDIQHSISDVHMRVYRSSDPLGVSLGGAYKNIIALAAGISDGLGLGQNTRAALITRGLSELVRLGIAMAAEKETLFGIAGLGDMVLTCTSDKSRNYSVGLEIGRGREAKEILGGMKHIAEGIYTTFGALHFAEKFGIELPIARSVHRIVWENYSPADEVRNLMKRPLKSEW